MATFNMFYVNFEWFEGITQLKDWLINDSFSHTIESLMIIQYFYCSLYYNS